MFVKLLVGWHPDSFYYSGFWIEPYLYEFISESVKLDTVNPYVDVPDELAILFY